jgi:hypothetical protein
MPERVCLRCQATFAIRPSRAESGRGKYCSRACAYPARVQATCAQCGASYSRKPSRFYGQVSAFCSRACMGANSQITLGQRLAENVDRSGGEGTCWPWTGWRNFQGYGRFQHRDRWYAAHRVAWEVASGRSVPDGLVVRHVVCDNPPCCNPAHLTPGTRQDNANDAIRAGRVPRGEHSAGHVLTEAIVRHVRCRHSKGEPASQIANALGFSTRTISAVTAGQTWKHVRIDAHGDS